MTNATNKAIEALRALLDRDNGQEMDQCWRTWDNAKEALAEYDAQITPPSGETGEALSAPLHPPLHQAMVDFILPVRLDIDKRGANWVYSVRDKRNRQLLTLNRYIPECEAIGAVVVYTLNELAESQPKKDTP